MLVGLGVAAALVVAARVVGTLIGYQRLQIGHAYPLSGGLRTHLNPWFAVTVAAAVLVCGGWPWLAARLPWRWLLAVSAPVAAGWAVALAFADGPGGLTDPLASRFQYPYNVSRVHDLGSYLATFNSHVVDPHNGPLWTVHTSGHPPGALGVFVLLDQAGLGGLGWAAALCVAGGALAVPSVLATVRLFGGDPLARKAALLVPVAPVALWVATTADALFAGVAAAGLCALAHAAARYDRRGDLLALAGGLALGCCPFLSYGLTLLAVPAIAVVVVQRRIRPLLFAGAVVVLLFALAYLDGFDWWQGLHLAEQATRTGPIGRTMPTAWQIRPGWYFTFGNLAALALAVGPLTVAGLALLRRDRVAVLALAAGIAVAGAVVSDLSRGEVERIYLPFAMWLVPFGALVPVRRDRLLVAVQLGWAVLLTAVVRTWW
jgi:methylthioxylose transferase